MKLITYTILTCLFVWGLWRLLKLRQPQNQQTRSHQPSHSAMDLTQAHDILGLADGATADDVIKAHRRLMQRLHPDKGGSVALAQQINQAKLVLLRHYEHH